MNISDLQNKLVITTNTWCYKKNFTEVKKTHITTHPFVVPGRKWSKIYAFYYVLISVWNLMSPNYILVKHTPSIEDIFLNINCLLLFRIIYWNEVIIFGSLNVSFDCPFHLQPYCNYGLATRCGGPAVSGLWAVLMSMVSSVDQRICLENM